MKQIATLVVIATLAFMNLQAWATSLHCTQFCNPYTNVCDMNCKESAW